MKHSPGRKEMLQKIQQNLAKRCDSHLKSANNQNFFICISNQSVPAIVQSHSQSQARLKFVTTLGMDNFYCTKMNTHFTEH